MIILEVDITNHMKIRCLFLPKPNAPENIITYLIQDDKLLI